MCCGDQSLPWKLSRVSPLLYGSHCAVRGRGISLVVGAEDPQVCFLGVFLACGARWADLEESSCGGGHRVLFLWSCSPVGVLHCVTFHPLCELSDYTDVGPALSPTLTVGVMATGPGVSLMLLSPCHQSRSTEIWF